MKELIFGMAALAALASPISTAYARDSATLPSYPQPTPIGQAQQTSINGGQMASGQAPHYVWKEGYERGRWRMGWVPAR